MASKRRAFDFYETAPYQVHALLHHQPIRGTVLEPCVGDGSIANIIRPFCSKLVTNDIDPQRVADFHYDAASPDFPGKFETRFDWVISNGPYKMPMGLDIIKNAMLLARVGVIMMQRISFKEPTKARGPWLRDHPITRELTLPRHSFTGNGKSDSATTSWFIWLRTGYQFASQFDGPQGTYNPHLSLFDAEKLFSQPVSYDTPTLTASV